MVKWIYFYIFSIFFRFILVFYCSAYIHPDEFFQSYEPMFRILGFKTFLSWEFSQSHQIRSWSGPFVLVGFPLKFVQLIMFLFSRDISLNKITPYVLYIIPRIWITILSLVTDLFLYKTMNYIQFTHLSAKFKNKLDLFYIMFIHGTSVPVVVFGTRTFTNTLEWISFSYIFYYIINNLNHKEPKIDKWFITLVVMTIFIRPTCIIFVIYPFAQHLASLLSSLNVYKILKYMGLLGYALFISIVLIIIDTLSYRALYDDRGNTSIKMIFGHLLSLSHFKNLLPAVTPLNFWRYNSQKKNLTTHGFHPFYTNLTINSLVLWGPFLSFIFYKYLIITIKNVYFGTNNLKLDTIGNKIKIYCFGSFLFPMIMLSFSPHQEPRFLLPLTLPLMLIYYIHLIRKDQSNNNLCYRILMILSLIIQSILWVTLSLYHQGGVIPSLIGIEKKFASYLHHSSAHNVIYAHTYMPPQFVLKQIEQSPSSPGKINIIDLGGRMSDVGALNTYIIDNYPHYPVNSMLHHTNDGNEKYYGSTGRKDFVCNQTKYEHKYQQHIYLAIPSAFMARQVLSSVSNVPYENNLSDALKFELGHGYITYKLIEKYSFHLSLENIPVISHKLLGKQRIRGPLFLKLYMYITNILSIINSQLYLNLYKISYDV